MKSYRDLLVWQESIKLVTEIYECTKDFPKSEIFSLTNQIKRAVVSIPSNIAEGQRRRTSRDFLQFAQIAYGSAAEVDTQLEISFRLGYLDKNKYAQLLEHTDYILKMLNKLTFALNRQSVANR
jgi:four helix bundle protein